MINYYQIIIIILISLILYNIYKKEHMTNISNKKEKILDLSIIEKKTKEDLNNISYKNQRFFSSPGNKYTKLQILTNFYTKLYNI